MFPPLGPMGPGLGPPPPTLFVSCCDICAREDMGSKEDVAGPMGPGPPWLGLMGMLSGRFILQGPGKGPGRLVLFGPPDNVVCDTNTEQIRTVWNRKKALPYAL